jgi:hypothetical protein
VWVISENDVLIDSSSIPDSNLDNTGSITFTFVGGNPPFDYTIVGPNNYLIIGTSVINQTTTINNLAAGVYTISGVGVFGIPISEIITVYGPQALAATAIVSKSSTDISNDGEITITNVIGGVSPYTYTLLDYAIPLNLGAIIEGPSLLNTLK